MTKQQKYRIVCLYSSDTWVVQDRADNGEWMECHRCEGKGKQGLEEAQQWINEQEDMI